HTSVEKLVETINEISDITSIESEMEVPTPVDIAKLLEDVEIGIGDALKNSKTHIHHDLKVREISFSKKNLRSILLNLIGNAIKYKSPERDPVITIKTELVSDSVVLSVQDNGLGMENDKIM